MELLCGKFQHESSENLDAYYKTIGVPYFVRIILCSSKLLMVISKEEENWSFKTSSLFRTSELFFKLGEVYTDKMPSGVELKNVTEIDENTIITKSRAQNRQEFERHYTFSENQMIMTLKHESGVEARRYFQRIG